MATYTSSFTNPYPNGWQDAPSEDTPINASALQAHTDALQAIDDYLAANPIPEESSGGTTDYEALQNKPTINGVEVLGNLTSEDLGLGGESGTTNYNDLTNKPSINGTELSGDITIDIPTKVSELENDKGYLTEVPEQSYNDLTDKPQINGIELQGNLTVEELGLLDITESTDTTLENSKDGVLKIKEIYGNTEQSTTSGKNLLDCSELTTKTTNGVTFTPVYADNGELEYINANGTATDVVYYSSNNITLPTGTYIANGVSGGSTSTYNIYGLKTGEWKSAFDTVANGDISFTLSAETEIVVRCRIASGYTANNVKFYPMIRLASITDGTYEPYTNGASPNPEYEQEIKSTVLSEIKSCGKNLFNSNAYKSMGYWSDANTFNNSASWYYYEIPIIKNTNYIISGRSSHASSVRIVGLDRNGNVLYNYGYIGGLINTSNSEIIGFSVKSTDFETLQLELGTTATEYEPYTESVATLSEPITLNGLNGVSDYVDVKRGVLVQKFEEKVFDGSDEAWSTSSNLTGRYMIKISNMKAAPTLALCTQFRLGVSSSVVANEFWSNGSYQQLAFNTPFSTVAEWKAHLASNPMTVVYELAEPIETPLADVDVIALNSLQTYDGVTHIFTDSEVDADWLVEYNTTRVGTELDEIDAELVKINKRITDIGTTAQINYSTEEQVIGTWIDGRPLYQKTIIGAFESSDKLTEIQVDDLQIDIIVNVTGMTNDFSDTTNYQRPIPMVYGYADSLSIAERLSIYYRNNAEGKKILLNYGGVSVNEYIVTIQYTKTTDTV